jgi:hypothetical protein
MLHHPIVTVVVFTLGLIKQLCIHVRFDGVVVSSRCLIKQLCLHVGFDKVVVFSR